MMNTKVVTVIVNRAQEELVLQVGNRSCFVKGTKLATIVDRSEHNVEIDINWTYHEFRLEPSNAGHVLQKMIFTSDDCCDFKHMKVTPGGHKLVISDKTYHSSRRATRSTAVEYSDPDHNCQTIPCDFCGRDWPRLI